MKHIGGVLIISAILLMPFSESFADEKKKSITPYGDFCPQCTKYGTCTSTMSHDEAKKAIMEYYQKKHLSAEIENKRGRFLKVKIKDGDKIVDVIIFDRQTGRVRSIY